MKIIGTKSIKLCDLKEDFEFYPRILFPVAHASYIAEAIESGASLPPIIVEEGTNRIVDGFNRRRALLKLYDPQHEVTVEVRKYKSDREFFEDAVRLNSSHGRILAPVEKVHAILKLTELGASIGDISQLVNLTETKINSMVERKTAVGSKGEVIKIKHTLQHLRGRKLTKKQIQANIKAGGMAQLYFINQVINLLENDSMDFGNDSVVAGLNRLVDLLASSEIAAA